jgi:hypothetical protein
MRHCPYKAKTCPNTRRVAVNTEMPMCSIHRHMSTASLAFAPPLRHGLSSAHAVRAASNRHFATGGIGFDSRICTERRDWLPVQRAPSCASGVQAMEGGVLNIL